MMRFSQLLASSAAVAVVVFAVRGLSAEQPLEKRIGPNPVVVELFTSQGCSSCPPADTLLRQLARNPALQGRVIPLAFHVDYWNYLGWRDPFSSADWSRRQMFYTHALGVSSAYTPQAIVGGRKQFVGSNASVLDAAIVEASQRKPEGDVTLNVNGNAIDVKASTPSSADTDLLLVIYENDITTSVKNGENGGSTLINDAIVRDLRNLGTFRSGSIERHATLTLRPEWKRDHLGIVALLQDRGTLAIRAAAAAKL